MGDYAYYRKLTTRALNLNIWPLHSKTMKYGLPRECGDDPNIMRGTRVRALGAYKDFLTLWKGRRPGHPDLHASQIRVRET
jgi:hypothetical protein